MMNEPERFNSESTHPLFKTANERISEDATTVDALTTALHDSSVTSAVDRQQPVSQAPVYDVTVKLVNLQALIATGVVLQVEEKVSSRTITASEEALFDVMGVDIGVIELGNQTLLANVVDTALFRALVNKQSNSAFDLRLQNKAESDQFIDAMARHVINNKSFISPLTYFIETSVVDQTENAPVQTILQTSHKI